MALLPSLCSPGAGVYARGTIIYRQSATHVDGARKDPFMALDQDSLTQLLDTVERFVNERLRPMEREVAENDQIPDHIATEMKELGLFGLSIPEEYGGLGLTISEEIQVARRLGHTSPAFRSLAGTNIGIGSQAIVIDGTPEQKAHYLPRLASGEIIGSFALTEPEAGSDAGSLKTTARREGNESYVISGAKRFITNAPHAGVFTVFARTDLASKDARGVSAFLVDAGLPGLNIGKSDKKMGQKGAHTADVIFDDVRVPAEAIVGGPAMENQGFKTAMRVLDRGRLHISSVCVGVAERLIDDALRYAMERKQFGQPIAEFQLVQAMLADSKAEAFAARCMVEETARRKDRGENVSTEAACCKLFASEMVGRVADRAVQIHGGAGYMAEYDVERFYRDVRLFRIYEGTSQIQQLVIARNMVREARM
jgi:acyl-CoA dehydrogenase